MQYGYSIPNNQGVEDPRDLVALGRHAESLGFSSLWVSEHLFHSSYVAERLGRRPYHDAVTLLTALACSTERARIGSSVLVLPWHHPVRLAKALATLDHLSGGRIDLGIGVAVTEDEFANLDVDFRTRGRRTDEMLAAMQVLWTEDLPAFDGEFHRFSGLAFEPKPLQSPFPVLIGGNSDAALRRVARYGTGWHALSQSPNELRAGIQRLHAALVAVERDPADVEVSIRAVVQITEAPSGHPTADRPLEDRRTLRGTPEEILRMLAAYDAAGADQVVLDFASGDVARNRALLEQLSALFRM